MHVQLVGDVLCRGQDARYARTGRISVGAVLRRLWNYGDFLVEGEWDTRCEDRDCLIDGSWSSVIIFPLVAVPAFLLWVGRSLIEYGMGGLRLPSRIRHWGTSF